MKLNFYQNNPTEFKRARKIMAAGMTQAEIQRFFLGIRSYEWLRAAGDNAVYRREHEVARAIIRLFLENKVPLDPIIPEIMLPGDPAGSQAPSQAPKPEIDLDAPICTGANCGGVSEIKRMLRWDKVLKGEPVTVSFDMKNAPKVDGLTRKVMEQEILKWVSGTPGLKIKFLKSGKGDVHIRFAYIDGQGDENGNILGMAFQPKKSLDMADGGDLSGDIIIDSGDLWPLRGLLKFLMTLRHEFGHAIGAPHLPNPGDTMYRAPTALNVVNLSVNDLEWSNDAYIAIAA